MRAHDLDYLDSLPSYLPMRRALHDADDSPRHIERAKRLKPWRRNRKEEE